MSEIVPDVVGVIEAWRAFQLTDDGMLAPVAMGRNVPWPTGKPMVARCESDQDHSAPFESCGCGVWALKRLEDIGLRFGANLLHGGYFAGRVALWGDIIPGDDGYRAQFAYPIKLYGVESKQDLLATIAERYGVPYATFATRAIQDDDGTLIVADFHADEYIESD